MRPFGFVGITVRILGCERRAGGIVVDFEDTDADPLAVEIAPLEVEQVLGLDFVNAFGKRRPAVFRDGIRQEISGCRRGRQDQQSS